ncbi:CLUMA_CG015720, isoform A [Clunio marinus]|uniref:CLUMA_CG015720, isoform A n=1 Tax=Clunio marinus TaxID=568069 RepID=A0A1J1IPR3_9DIPT|nr:CLUMA_CG015720, isoform A [Clunio marinus]
MTSEFKNIKKLPVDKVILEENIPALSDKWIKKRSFSKYIPIKLKKGRVDESFDFDDEWISETEKFNRDLEWILGLNYHK